MKKTFLLLILIVSVSVVYGQQIQNNGFEEWTSDSLPNPVGYATFNQLLDEPFVTQSTDAHSGSYSVKLQTRDVNIGRVSALMFSSNDPSAFSFGVPYNVRPIKVIGWAKYNVPGIDTSTFAITLMHYNEAALQSEEVGSVQLYFTGVQNSWNAFTADFEYSLTDIPDTIIVFASTSITDSANQQLSALWLDDIMIEGGTGVMVSNPIVLGGLFTYPNPANGSISLYTPDFNYGDYIEVRDLAGRVLASMNIISNNTVMNLNMPGMYIVEVKSINGVTLRRNKVINQ